jgi:uncharacterized membrane protein (DUF485 family)
MWSIRVLSGQHTGQIYDLKMGKNVFGRGGISDLKIQSLGISKEHCEIHVYKDKMMIVDLKSSNGTFVNGVKIQNSIIRVGDKVSLFDVIMDIIPAPDIRPKAAPKQEALENPPIPVKKKRPSQPVAAYNSAPPIPNYPMSYPLQGNAALQMQSPVYQSMPNQFSQLSATAAQAAAPALTMSEKIENYIENVVMPGVYKLGIVFSFKQILQAFVLIFIFSVTLLSIFPLTNIIKESNMQESVKRARSVARAMAKFNEQALLSGQTASLSVAEAQKEEGIKDAFIIQQSDGLIIAPPDKAGRDDSNPLVLAARKEQRATWARIDNDTIGASFPIATYDATSGEATPKYHAIVTYDISSLNVDEGRVMGLFMQTLVIASVLGLLLYFLFARLIEFPIKSLNQQIEKALIEKSDRTEVPFDYPAFQKLVSNVNTILNRVLTGDTSSAPLKPQQNKDLEYSNLADMISHPVIIVDAAQRVVAINSGFEELAQTSKEMLINQSYQSLNDTALVQNIESLVARAQQSPFEKQSDRIPFSQFECDIHCQVFLNADNDPEYFILTLTQINT